MGFFLIILYFTIPSRFAKLNCLWQIHPSGNERRRIAGDNQTAIYNNVDNSMDNNSLISRSTDANNQHSKYHWHPF
jgi:hypothetical protein